MKRPLHLCELDEPMMITEIPQTNCGKELAFCAITPLWDGQEMNVTVEIPMGVCKKCLKNRPSGKRYIYAVREMNKR